jgi:hypothetical protein
MEYDKEFSCRKSRRDVQTSVALSLSLTGAAGLALSPFAVTQVAAEDIKVAQSTGSAQKPVTAADLGVMGVSLKDSVKLNYGIQGQLQGAGTPNQAGIGGFLPLRVGKQSVTFLDVLANVNFADYSGYSSIVSTTVAGGTISTSTRLGQRWLNRDRSWMYGFNFGYDSRPMATGPADTGVNVSNSQTVFFQQMAFNAEAVSNRWSANGYWLMPIGQYGWGSSNVAQLNSNYAGDSLNTIGGDIGYNITPEAKLSLGYYYQDGDLNTADASGIKTRLSYSIANGLTAGFTYSYDPIFQSVATGDLKWRFGANGYGAPSKRTNAPPVMPVIQALSTTPANRDVPVHDNCYTDTSSAHAFFHTGFYCD